MVFNGVRQSTPIEKSKQAKPSKQGKAPSKRQANPAPRQAKNNRQSFALVQSTKKAKQAPNGKPKAKKPLRANLAFRFLP
jgi:hypothetical protein